MVGLPRSLQCPERRLLGTVIHASTCCAGITHADDSGCAAQLSRFSLVRAAERTGAAKRKRADPDNDQEAEEREIEQGVKTVGGPSLPP